MAEPSVARAEDEAPPGAVYEEPEDPEPLTIAPALPQPILAGLSAQALWGKEASRLAELSRSAFLELSPEQQLAERETLGRELEQAEEVIAALVGELEVEFKRASLRRKGESLKRLTRQRDLPLDADAEGELAAHLSELEEAQRALDLLAARAATLRRGPDARAHRGPEARSERTEFAGQLFAARARLRAGVAGTVEAADRRGLYIPMLAAAEPTLVPARGAGPRLMERLLAWLRLSAAMASFDEWLAEQEEARRAEEERARERDRQLETERKEQRLQDERKTDRRLEIARRLERLRLERLRSATHRS